MNIRLLEAGDIEKIEQIHKKFYDGEFVLPFNRKLLNKYIVESDDGKIITFGALELNAEVIAITDKDIDIKDRREALYKLYQAMLFEASHFKFDLIQCSVTDPYWERHLKKIGFVESKGKLLVHKV